MATSLAENLNELHKIFDLCADISFRRFSINCEPAIHAVAIFADSMVDEKIGSETILKSIMQETSALPAHVQITKTNAFQILGDRLLTVMSIKSTSDYLELTDYILKGAVAIQLDGSAKALICFVGGPQGRPISEATTEPVVRGPRDGFVEDYKTNLWLIRKRIKSSRLKVELLEIGAISNTTIALCYIKGIVQDSLVEEVKTRLNRIKIDSILSSGAIEEMIMDEPFSLFPLVQTTERPDKVAGSLFEGGIAIIVDNTPIVLLAPTTFVALLQASEDYYNNYIFATCIRLLRFAALNLALLLPSITVAIMSFHQEVIPQRLLELLLNNRSQLPFPLFIEVLAMEVIFEFLREAGVRLPKTVGQAVSIVGGLVIGQSAVDAGMVGVIPVIVVALTAICTFTIPNYAAGTTIRILRFPLIILASIIGGVGIMVGLMFLLFYLCGLRSFGIPYLSPIAPLSPGDLKDTLLRFPWWGLLTRPRLMGAKEPARMETNQGPTKPSEGEE